MYRDCTPAAKAPNPVQVPSGVGVLPVRTMIATLDADGLAIDWRLCQLVFTPASNTRDVNAPEAAYGLRRFQSTMTFPLRPLNSLAAMVRIGPATASECTAGTKSPVGTPLTSGPAFGSNMKAGDPSMK